MSDSSSAFTSLTEALQRQIAEFLTPQDLLHLHCVSVALSRLDTDAIWKRLCQERWEPWPRYRLTAEKCQALQEQRLLPEATNWKQRYLMIEHDATRTTLRESDLHNLSWTLSYNGTGGSRIRIRFFSDPPQLFVPGFRRLPYRFVRAPPPRPEIHLARRFSAMAAELTFSRTQWLDINNFPSHLIARQRSNSEWIIVNENVVLTSRGAMG